MTVDDDEEGLPAPDEHLVEQARRVKSSSLLWFISSRPYVPMPDIRRRFGLYTDSGTWLRDEEGPVHIGLPQQAAETLLDLKRRSKIDLQYDLEYATRIAVGVFPLRIRFAPAPAPTRPLQTPAPAISVDSVAANDDLLDEGVESLTEAGALTERTSARSKRRRRRR